MKLFKSNEPNTFHYVTLVTYNRIPVFRSERACELFVEVLSETREKYANIPQSGSGQAIALTCRTNWARCRSKLIGEHIGMKMS